MPFDSPFENLMEIESVKLWVNNDDKNIALYNQPDPIKYLTFENCNSALPHEALPHDKMGRCTFDQMHIYELKLTRECYNWANNVAIVTEIHAKAKERAVPPLK